MKLHRLNFSKQLTLGKSAILAIVLSTGSSPALAESKPSLTSSSNDHTEYPQMARKKGVQGAVKLSYDINARGKATNIRQVGKASRQLYLSAKAALKKETFEVALVDGQPQTITNRQRIYRFNLTNLDERGRLIKNSAINTQIASR